MRFKKFMATVILSALTISTAAVPALAADTGSNTGAATTASSETSSSVKYVDGTYTVPVTLTGTMISIAKADNKTGKLTVKNGNEFTITIRLEGSGLAYLFDGTAEEAAAADESQWIARVMDSEDYATYTFKVNALDTDISLAKCSERYMKANNNNGHSVRVTVDGSYKGKQIWYDGTVLNVSSQGIPAQQDTPDTPDTPSAPDKKALAVKGVKVTGQKKALKVSWTRNTSATGYQIQYSEKKNFTKKKTVNVNKAATVKTTIKKLKGKKKYYVRVRGVYKADQASVYGSWSTKSARTK